MGMPILSYCTVRSKLVNEYLFSLSIALSFIINLVVVPDNKGVGGNYETDKLGRGNSLVSITLDWERTGSPWFSCVLSLDVWTSRELSRC